MFMLHLCFVFFQYFSLFFYFFFGTKYYRKCFFYDWLRLFSSITGEKMNSKMSYTYLLWLVFAWKMQKKNKISKIRKLVRRIIELKFFFGKMESKSPRRSKRWLCLNTFFSFLFHNLFKFLLVLENGRKMR